MLRSSSCRYPKSVSDVSPAASEGVRMGVRSIGGLDTAPQGRGRAPPTLRPFHKGSEPTVRPGAAPRGVWDSPPVPRHRQPGEGTVLREQPANPVPTPSLPSRLAAGAVHVYTASGSVLGLLIVVAAVQGRVVTALWLGLAAMVVDGTDGMLARRLRVKELIPWFDGAGLDNIVDYLTYAFAPVVLLWAIGA